MNQLLLALAMVPALAQAEPFQCTTRVRDMGEVRVAKLEIELQASPGYMQVEGARKNFLGRESAKITGVAEYLQAVGECAKAAEPGKLACAKEAEEQKKKDCLRPVEGAQLECSTKAMMSMIPEAGTESELVRMAKLGVVFMKIQQDAPMEERTTDIEIDLSKIASVKAYQADEASKWGVPGLYEYFDAQGALLGRFLIATPYVIPCK